MCVLVVEDEFLIREMVQEALEDAGYEVLAAEHGLEAFHQIDSYPDRFTCLVTDYHLNGTIHGGHVIERMRSLYPTIPMILASAYPMAITTEWRVLHEVDLLIKPYSPEELIDLVNQRMHT